MIAVCYHATTRALLGVAPTFDDLLLQLGGTYPAQSVTTALPEWSDVPPAPYEWNVALTNFTLPSSPFQLRPLAFRWRYTLAEQVAIKVAETSDPDPTVRATLAILRESLEIGDYVDTKDLRTVQGVQYHASRGLIQPSRVAAILGYDPNA